MYGLCYMSGVKFQCKKSFKRKERNLFLYGLKPDPPWRVIVSPEM